MSGIMDFCQVKILSLLNVDSTNIQPEHWQMIVQAIEDCFDCYDGFVITHGTDSHGFLPPSVAEHKLVSVMIRMKEVHESRRTWCIYQGQ